MKLCNKIPLKTINYRNASKNHKCANNKFYDIWDE